MPPRHSPRNYTFHKKFLCHTIGLDPGIPRSRAAVATNEWPCEMTGERACLSLDAPFGGRQIP